MKSLDIKLLKQIVEQIKEDAENKDYTAIEDLFLNIPHNKLIGFLCSDFEVEK